MARGRSAVAVVSGATGPGGATGLLTAHAAAALRALGHPVEVVEAHSLPAVGLLDGDRADPLVSAALGRVLAADALALVAPADRATHCGLVKSVLGLLPRGSLTGVPVLPVTTGGPQGRGAVESCLRPLLSGLGATQVLDGPFLPAASVLAPDGGLDGTAAARVVEGLAELSSLVGHRRRRPVG